MLLFNIDSFIVIILYYLTSNLENIFLAQTTTTGTTTTEETGTTKTPDEGTTKGKKLIIIKCFI